MKIRHALTLSALLPVLAACAAKDGSADVSPAAAAPAAEAPAETAPAAETAAPAQAATPPQGPAPVEGTDYVSIPGGQPFDPLNGKVEVVEMFNYICPACYSFDSQFHAWTARQPAYVRVTYVPAQFRPDFTVYAKAYYAADSLGIAGKTHEAVYKAVHLDHALPGEGQSIDPQKIAEFYAKYGVTAKQFTDAMNSFGVAGKMNKANQFAMRSQIEGTPTVIVNGKYRVKGRSWDDMLRITDHLIAREHAGAAQ
jgi:thiol:disulfide interchange protein DsbA